jgi:hypothetical protein
MVLDSRYWILDTILSPASVVWFLTIRYPLYAIMIERGKGHFATKKEKFRQGSLATDYTDCTPTVSQSETNRGGLRRFILDTDLH